MDATGTAPTVAQADRARARTSCVAAGAIGTPALLLRSARPIRTRCWASARSCIPTVISARADAGDGRRLRRRAADDLLATTSWTRSRSTARSASSSRRRRCIRCWPRSRCPATARRTRNGCATSRACRCLIALLRDGFHPQSAGRHGAPARRRHAGARLSADAVSCGTACGARSWRWRRSSSPRARSTCCRCTARRAVHELGARRKAAIDAFDLRPLLHARRVRARDGRRAVRPRSARARSSTSTAATITCAISPCATARCSRPRSAPIRSCRSTRSPHASRAGSRRSLV